MSVVSFLANAWGDVGAALYDVPDTELAALVSRLHDLAASEPGRTGSVFAAFASMAETEAGWRRQQQRTGPA